MKAASDAIWSDASDQPWLVSAHFDLLIFGLPTLIALILVAFESHLAPSGEVGPGLWIATIVLVDVAHVWSTLFRTYLDRDEFRRKRIFYVVVPVTAYALGVALHAQSSMTFWTALAYLAVLHFVRQQYGWVALYNRRSAESALDRAIDAFAIYAATLFPLLWWHAHLPRNFEWFMPGYFFGMPQKLITILWPIYVLALGVFGGRQVVRVVREGVFRAGKVLVVVTTALCWGVGIIATNSDYAFTVTNVLIHGVPYMAIIWVYGRKTSHRPETFLQKIFSGPVIVFYAILVAFAYLEEFGWDRLIFHDHPGVFFGPEVHVSSALLTWLVPLLALPQATHYVLDARIWKTRQNPDLARAMNLPKARKSFLAS